MNVRKNFDGYADDYTVGRPQYAVELIDRILEGSRPDSFRIADIGSGTGKFTSQLLERGYEVYSVEPNDDMRRVAEEELKSFAGFHSVTLSRSENSKSNLDISGGGSAHAAISERNLE